MYQIMLTLALAMSLAGCSDVKEKPVKKDGDSETAMLTTHKPVHQEADLKILSTYIKPDAKILDLGAGTGIGPRQLCKNGYRNVVSVERSQEEIKAAEEAKNIETCKTEYIEGNINKGLSLPDGQFDMVTAFSAYQCFSTANCIKEVARLLKPQGYYFITRGLLKNSDPVRIKTTQIIEEVTGQKAKDPTFDPEKQLEEQGFKIVLHTTIPIVEYFTKDEYMNYIKAYPSWELAKNSPKLKEVQSKIEQYLSTLTNADGVIKIEINAPVILAQKQ